MTSENISYSLRERSQAAISLFRLHDLLLNESGLRRLEGKRVTCNARLHSGRVQRGNIPGGHEHLYRIKSDELPVWTYARDYTL